MADDPHAPSKSAAAKARMHTGNGLRLPLNPQPDSGRRARRRVRRLVGPRASDRHLGRAFGAAVRFGPA